MVMPSALPKPKPKNILSSQNYASNGGTNAMPKNDKAKPRAKFGLKFGKAICCNHIPELSKIFEIPKPQQ